MKKYKIVYWHNGNKCVKEIEATNAEQARLLFYMAIPQSDIISVKEVE
jgi:hypothetical protein